MLLRNENYLSINQHLASLCRGRWIFAKQKDGGREKLPLSPRIARTAPLTSGAKNKSLIQNSRGVQRTPLQISY